jgi:hypothetical protein
MTVDVGVGVYNKTDCIKGISGHGFIIFDHANNRTLDSGIQFLTEAECRLNYRYHSYKVNESIEEPIRIELLKAIFNSTNSLDLHNSINKIINKYKPLKNTLNCFERLQLMTWEGLIDPEFVTLDYFMKHINNTPQSYTLKPLITFKGRWLLHINGQYLI